jgi:hypothetical protein
MSTLPALENLAGPGKVLVVEPVDANELAGLLQSGRVRLADAAQATLSLESRFDLAYNAAHALCLAALRWWGYRPRQRYIVFQLLPLTLQLGPEVWRVLAKAHDARNLAEYEGHADIGERLVLDVIAAAQVVLIEADRLFAEG